MFKQSADILEKIGVEDYNLKFTYDDLRNKVFEPVVTKVLDLIKQQLDHPEARRKMDAIFMVGGFSQSPYLESRIKETFSERVNIISVVPRGELAIVRGAVLLGIQPTIIAQRIAKHTYGLQTRARFERGKDLEEFRDISGEYCNTRFELIVEKNQKLPNNHSVSRKYIINAGKATLIGKFSYLYCKM